MLDAHTQGVLNADMLVQATGVLFLYAIAAEFVVMIVEQAGAAFKQDAETKTGDLPALALMIVATLTPGLLLLHGYLSTESASRAAQAAAAGSPSAEIIAAGYRVLQIAAVGAPIVAVVAGAVFGRILGSASQGAARFLGGVALPLALAAFVLTIYATWPSIGMLIEFFTRGSVRLPPAG